MALEVRKLLVLSTAHVSPETATMLNTTKDMEWPCIGGHYNEYGWFMYAHEADDRTDWASRGEIPDDLMGVMTYARSKGCHNILFDRDADTVDELPTYEW